MQKALAPMNNESWKALAFTGGGWPGDYDIVRSLGHAGIRSAVASSDPSSIAFYSRFVDRRVVLPPIEQQHEHRILRSLLEISSRQQERPVLYYVGDSELLFVAKYAGVLSSTYRFLLPDEQLLGCITNKAAFYDFAERHQLPVPRTMVVASSDELVDRLKEVEFPCIVKPPYNRDWFWRSQQRPARNYKEGLRKIESPKELVSFCNNLPTWGSGIIVQSYVQGGENQTTSFLGYFDEHSQCLGSFIGREVRTNPPVTGNPTFSEIIEQGGLEQFSVDTLGRLGMKGIVKVDYAWDDRERMFRILEIEPHYQPWHLLGSYLGCNLAMIAYRHQRGETMDQRVRARMGSLLYFRPDLEGYLKAYWKTGGWPIGKYFNSLLQTDCYRIFDPRDMKPFLASVAGFCRRLMLRLFQRHVPAKVVYQ